MINERCEIWPVLKSNAYGHGIEQIVSILNKEKFKYFVVDSYFEAVRIREISNKNILIIGSTNPVNFKLMDFTNLALMIQDRESIIALGKLKKKVKIHLKINTGMNRQGFDPDEIEDIIRLIKVFPSIEVEGVFSHLADLDNTMDSFTGEQERKFLDLTDRILGLGVRPKYFHLSATACLKKIKNSRVNAARIGVGLYGFADFEGLKPALRMISVFTKIRTIKKGDKIGYNCTFIADRKMNMGIVPVGYYEALDRRLGNCGFVKYKNDFLEIIGRICMNLSMVNLGDRDGKIFDDVEIISWNSEDKNSIMNIVKICGTVPGEILTKISETVRREVV